MAFKNLHNLEGKKELVVELSYLYLAWKLQTHSISHSFLVGKLTTSLS
jgi:hypothetical protein